MTDWHAQARALAARLTADGALTDPAWRAAIEATPRHRFVPEVPVEDAYTDDALVTQTRPGDLGGGAFIEIPTSSASAPEAVAVMLENLNITDGARVLEIGTGTGYNAALLCHRLGPDRVYSVDLDPALVDRARDVLADLDYHPTLKAADGYAGLPSAAPFDAILATCSVTQIPPAWITQLAPGGRIVAPLHGGTDAALMVLTKTAPDEVVGHFDPHRMSFMPLRPRLDDPLAGPRASTHGRMPHYGTTTLDPERLTNPDDELALFLHLHIPGLSIGTTEGGPTGKAVTISDAASLAEVPLIPAGPGRWTALQRGPARLWDTVEHAAALWDTLGRPGRDRLGITALDDPDRQYIWLDDPDGPYSWPMPL